MPTVTHEYPVTIDWKGGRDGKGSSTFSNSGESFALAVPPEFGGEGKATNPEELLAGAVAGCYAIMFGIVTANRKLPIESIKVDAVGEVDQTGASFTYKKITVRPYIVASSDSTDEQLAAIKDMAHKTDQYCIVTNAVRGKVEVSIEPNVTKAS